MTRRCFLGAASVMSAALAESRPITAFGAVADGKTNNREAIQRAIDEAAARGGGTVLIPSGRFVSGSLRMKSGVALWLDHGATLVAIQDPSQYEARRPTDRLPPDSWQCAFLLAENAERLSVLGAGAITGAGFAKPRVEGTRLQPLRPRLLSFEHCRDVVVQGVTLRDADRWTLHFYDCDSVRAQDLRIRAAYDIVNTDGIDIDGSRNVVVSGCEIVAGDDCVVLKTTNYLGEPRPCENVTVSNCVLSTRASALKIGTETHADFANITFANCVVYGSGVHRPDGVCLESVDGSHVRGVAVSNISMRHVRTPLFVRVGSRAALSSLEDAVIDNIVARDATMASSITGIPSRAVRQVSVSDVRLLMAGGGDAALAQREVPEKEAAYPSGRMFGDLPAYGFYVRHAQGVRLRNISLSSEQSDGRPALIADDVSDLAVEAWRGSGSVRLHGVRDAVVRGAMDHVRVSGAKSAGIAIAADHAALDVQRDPEVPPESVTIHSLKK